MLSIDSLHVSYGGAIKALQGVSVEVADGAVVALLGSNGAGKSTLLRTISGVLPVHKGAVTSGDVKWQGRSLRHENAAAIVRRGIVQVPEGRRIFTRLTVDDNLRAGAATNRNAGKRTEARRRVMELFPLLDERRNQRAGLLSGGEQQMLAIGRALMSEPKLLLLDEPSLGLAPRIIEQIGQVIAEINRQGTSVLLVEQNATMALSVATSAYVLELGRVSLSGSAAELSESDEVRRLYLGEQSDVGGAADASTVGSGRHRTLSAWSG